MQDHTLPQYASATTAYFFKGLFFGVLLTVAVQAFFLYRIAQHLLNPNTRITNPNKPNSDRPSFAKEFVAVTGSRLGTRDNDHEVLRDDLLLGDKNSSKSSNAAQGAAAQHPSLHKTSREHNEPWPEHIIAFLKAALAPDLATDTPVPPLRKSAKDTATPQSNTSSSAIPGTTATTPASFTNIDSAQFLAPAEKVDWLNVLATRFFLALRGSQLFKDKARAKWTGKINDKLKGNAWVSHVEIVDIAIGDCAPKIQSVRLMKAVTEDLAVSAEVDVTYDGGGSIAIQTTLVGGLKLPVRVHISGFAGKLRLRCPSIQWADMIGVAFVDDPGTTFRVDSALTVRDNELLRGMVNKLLASVVRKVFLELWVLPSWRTFFMPLMEPKLEDVLARQNAAKEAPPALPVRKSLATKASTLWENRSPLLRGKNGSSALLGDALANVAFPTTIVLNPQSPEVETMEENLVTAFLRYAWEKSSDMTIPPSVGQTPADESTQTAASDSDREADIVTIASTDSTPSPVVATAWKSVRNRNNIHVEKKRVLIDGEVAEITRASIQMQCDAERVFSVLSNPEHDRHVDDSYVGSEIVHQYDDGRGVRHTRYKFGRQGHREFATFLVKRRIGATAKAKGSRDPDSVSISTTASVSTSASLEKTVEYVVVSRSIAAFHDTPEVHAVPVPASSTSDFDTAGKHIPAVSHETLTSELESPVRPDPVVAPTKPDAEISSLRPPIAPSPSTELPVSSTKVFLYGYLITADEASPTDTCHVTILSQLSQDLSRIEVSYDSSRKLKTFIEELASLSGLAATRDRDTSSNSLRRSPSNSTLRKRRFFSDSSSHSSSMTSSFASTATSGTAAGDLNQGRKIDKIKSFVGSTAGYLIKSRRVAGWLGKNGNGVDGDLGSPANDSMDERPSATHSETPSVCDGDYDSSETSRLYSAGDIPKIVESLDESGGNNVSDAEILSDLSEESHSGGNSHISKNRSSSFQSLPELSFDHGSILEEDSEGERESKFEFHATPQLSVERTSGPPTLPPRRPGSASSSGTMLTGRGRSASLEVNASTKAMTAKSSSERIVAPRAQVYVDIPFRRSTSHAGPMQLKWEYVISTTASASQQQEQQVQQQHTQNQSLIFSLVFVPDQHEYSESHRGFLTLFPTSPSHLAGRYLVPPTTVHAPQTHPALATIPLPSTFPDGKFLFGFDNSSEKRIARKVELMFSIEPPVLHGSGSDITNDSVVRLDMAVPRKQVVRYPFAVDIVDASSEVCWEFVVAGGYEIGFAVLFQPDMQSMDDDEDVVLGRRSSGGESDSHNVGRVKVDEHVMLDSTGSTPALSSEMVNDEKEVEQLDSDVSRAHSNDQLAGTSAAPSDAARTSTSTAEALTSAVVAAAASVTTAALAPTIPAIEMTDIVNDLSHDAVPSSSPPASVISQPAVLTPRTVRNRPSLSSRLAAAVTGKSQPSIAITASQASLAESDADAPAPVPHAIQPLQKVRGSVTGSVPAAKGLYYFVWDNSQAVVVGRRVGVRLWIQ
ncbi:hypothetical protein PhCBS80983_g02273 [Powellomyces hirtus]|uniref:SMP-LTD domain-containing protein n=1 Tax=Powellomyces hirtus TaxID=109895 RepID=A0A507E7N8_9FUNG|nr:hypothetical protein PhCBS80983_g02273 [Powellomyces hirtus]